MWNLESVGDHAWFSFDASQGSSYEIQTELLGLPGRSGYADLDANHEGLIEGVIAPFRYWYTCGVRPTGKAGGAERSCPALGVNMRG